MGVEQLVNDLMRDIELLRNAGNLLARLNRHANDRFREENSGCIVPAPQVKLDLRAQKFKS